MVIHLVIQKPSRQCDTCAWMATRNLLMYPHIFHSICFEYVNEFDNFTCYMLYVHIQLQCAFSPVHVMVTN